MDSYIPKDNSLQSETVHYKRGVGQQFCLPSHTVDPSEWAEEEVSCLRGQGQASGSLMWTQMGLGPSRDSGRQCPDRPDAGRPCSSAL